MEVLPVLVLNIFRLKDLDIESNWKYNISYLYTISNLRNFFARHFSSNILDFSISIFKKVCFLNYCTCRITDVGAKVTVTTQLFCWIIMTTAFIVIKWSFLDVFPLSMKVTIRSKREQVSSISKNIENGDGISLYSSTITQHFQTMVFIQIFGKSL